MKKQGYPVERRADDLRVSAYHLPYLLSTNDIMIDLSPYGWEMEDSREVKKRYQLNRSENIQGILKSPGGKEYVFYQFMSRTSAKNIEKTVSELNKNQFTDYMMFTKGGSSFKSLLEKFTTGAGIKVSKYQSLKLFPYVFAKYYLRAFEDEERILEFVEDYGVSTVSFKTHFKNQKSGLNLIVDYNNQEYYFVNLLDTDMKKIYNIKQYRKEDYERNGRKVLVLTNNQLSKSHKEALKDTHHVEYLIIDHNEMIDYLLMV